MMAIFLAPYGIIPARAGFTSEYGERDLAEPDHPRSRGVYELAARNTSGGQGSSPLARGLLLRLREAIDDLRIIPARAGFTRARHL